MALLHLAVAAGCYALIHRTRLGMLIRAGSTDRDKIGYMIGMDVAKSVAPALPDMDMAAFPTE